MDVVFNIQGARTASTRIVFIVVQAVLQHWKVLSSGASSLKPAALRLMKQILSGELRHQPVKHRTFVLVFQML